MATILLWRLHLPLRETRSTRLELSCTKVRVHVTSYRHQPAHACRCRLQRTVFRRTPRLHSPRATLPNPRNSNQRMPPSSRYFYRTSATVHRVHLGLTDIFCRRLCATSCFFAKRPSRKCTHWSKRICLSSHSWESARINSIFKRSLMGVN